MSPNFASAATLDEDNRMVITSDWDGTLVDTMATNFELFEFLSDAHQAGHRVIIASTLSPSKIRSTLDLVVQLGRMRGYQLIDADAFEVTGKGDVHLQNLLVDYAFDNEPIASQHIPYCDPAVEVRIGPDFAPSMPLDNLRRLCGLPQKSAAEATTAPRPTL